MDSTPSNETRSESNVDESLLSLVPERLREGVLSSLKTPERGLQVKHGTYRTYRYYHCRCADCSAYASTYRKAYRERNLTKERAQDRVRYDHKRMVINEAKAVPCSDCGVTYPPECMDFDHIAERGGKIAAVSAMVSRWAEDDIIAEIAKCEVVCANCHRIRTKNRRDNARGD